MKVKNVEDSYNSEYVEALYAYLKIFRKLREKISIVWYPEKFV